jgi:5-hydroxyisourate hydrolase-like protein (transthyretin family)
MALIASDLAGDLGIEGAAVRAEVERMILAANHKGEELVVSLMVTKEVLTRILSASNVDANTRVAVALWLETPLTMGHFRVVAIAGEQVRAATVDGVSELDEAPVSSSMLN